jgi:hypothetical protein
MIFTPSAGPLGAHPVNYTTKCVVQTATVSVNTVVCTAFLSTSVVDPSLGYDPLYVFNTVAPVEGDATNNNGYVGVVTDLNGTDGSVNKIVTVQFGGIANARVTSSGNLAIGANLTASDTAGILTDTGGTATGTVPCAILMETVTGVTTNVARRVFIPLQYWFRIAI